MKTLNLILLAGLLLTAGTAVAADASSSPPPLRHHDAPAVTSSAADPVWTDLGDELTASLRPGSRETMPLKYRALRLDFGAMKARLAGAPHEKDVAVSDGLVIALPLPDGTHQRFAVVESPILGEELQAEMPDFRTYLAQGIDDPTAVLRLDTSGAGFHAYGRTIRGTLWIDPYEPGDTEHYLSAWRHDFAAPVEGLDCGSVGDGYLPELDGLKSIPASGTQLRTYRMILTLTGEYTTYFGGATAAQSQAATTLNRVNSVYEVDVCVRFTLTGFQTYVNPATDPFPNGTSVNGALLDQNQSVTDAIQGAANYDIGHILTQGANGGLAGLGVVCTSTKARGGTGRPVPSGDPFDIDYVAHEIGHQMGGSHTFNGTTSTCGGGNRSAANAYEPGSGTTIMAYAGICGAENVQANSDPLFHVRSLEQIISTKNGSGCGTDTPTGNTPPTANAGADRIIPRGTPFYVIGSVTDPDPDAHTFIWEQYDLGAASPPTDPYGPLFRSFTPTTGSSRYFPDSGQIFSGAADPWEILPTVDRSLTLRLTVRDNAPGGGGVDDDELELTVQGAPFQVTYPNGGESFTGGEPVTVTWNVGGSVGTDVRIYLITDSTFVSLISNTANDGSESVTMPCGSTITDGRIWVEELTGASEGVHIFDVSDTDFSLTDGTPDFAVYTYAGSGDAVVANSANTGALPTSLAGDGASYLRWSFANLGSAYGCDGFRNDFNLDEATLVQWTAPIRPQVSYLQAIGPVQVRGGRHTLWQTMDPENVQAETNETNNAYARQWVWTPAPIADESATRRAQPPERFAGHGAIPGGVTAYANMDGLFMDQPVGTTWRAAAIGSLNGSDYDVYFFTPSSGPEDGFETPLVSSRYGGGATDVVLTNHAFVGPVTYDVGYERFTGDGDFVADVRESGTPLVLNATATGQAVLADQIIDLGGLTVTGGDLGWITLVVENVTAGQPVQLLLFDPSAGVYGRVDAAAVATVDADGRAVLSLQATVAGEYAWLLVRDAVEGLAPFTYDIRALAEAPDIAMATLAGSHGPVIPRPDASIAPGDPVPAPALLPGDGTGTFIYYHVSNEGPGAVPAWDFTQNLDGEVLFLTNAPFALPSGPTAIFSQGEGGATYVSGGRHTLGLGYDGSDAIVEIFEDNNRFAEQWVWEPTQLTMGQSVTRAAPPAPQGGWDDIPVGLTRLSNQDGLRTPAYVPSGGNGYWGGFALTPLGAGDIDLALHAPSTGAQDGFDDNLENSEYGGDTTEFMLFDLDGALPAGTAFDAGAVLYSAGTPLSYRAHAMESLYLTDTPVGSTFGPYTLADGELMGLYEFGTFTDGDPDITFTLHLDNQSGNADLVLVVQERTEASGIYLPFYTMPGGPVDVGGPGADESLELTLAADQYVAVAVIKKGGGDVSAAATYALEFVDPTTSDVGDLPAMAASLEAYPNPFNPQTNLSFTLASAGRASLQIFDAQGKLVRTLAAGVLPAGTHTAVWKGRDDAGRAVASGVYLARLVHPDGVERRRMVLMK